MLKTNNPFLRGDCSSVPEETHTRKYFPVISDRSTYIVAQRNICEGCTGCLLLKEMSHERYGLEEINTVRWFKKPKSEAPEHFYSYDIKLLLKKASSIEREKIQDNYSIKRILTLRRSALLLLYEPSSEAKQSLDKSTLSVIESELYGGNKSSIDYTIIPQGNDAAPPASATPPPTRNGINPEYYFDIWLTELLFDIVSVCRFL